jgi:hypothetical protein
MSDMAIFRQQPHSFLFVYKPPRMCWKLGQDFYRAIHLDTPYRDSLACDLMEPVRPQVDAYFLDWISREPLKREWFFEHRDGNCRLMGSFAARLSETAPTWGRAVAPFAEWVAQTLRTPERKPASRDQRVPTRLTQRRRRNLMLPIFALADTARIRGTG